MHQGLPIASPRSEKAELGISVPGAMQGDIQVGGLKIVIMSDILLQPRQKIRPYELFKASPKSKSGQRYSSVTYSMNVVTSVKNLCFLPRLP